MIRYFKIQQLRDIQACVGTIGNFDGVHLGHQALIKASADKAKKNNLPSVLITFDPHPSTLFCKTPIMPLTDLETRLNLIEKMGIDICFVLPFTKEFAQQKATDFIEIVLQESIQCKELFVGHNFKMGSDQVTDSLLESELNKISCKLNRLEEVTLYDKFTNTVIEISSTQIRKALEQGNVLLAKEMLGRMHTVQGTIVHGAKRGSHLLGFPTANMDTGDLLLPKQGVYATYARFPELAEQEKDRLHFAISNIGYNPTFAGTKLIIETYILDYNAQIYGEKMEVNFLSRIRDEEKFTSVDDLIKQLKADESTRRTLN